MPTKLDYTNSLHRLVLMLIICISTMLLLYFTNRSPHLIWMIPAVGTFIFSIQNAVFNLTSPYPNLFTQARKSFMHFLIVLLVTGLVAQALVGPFANDISFKPILFLFFLTNLLFQIISLFIRYLLHIFENEQY